MTSFIEFFATLPGAVADTVAQHPMAVAVGALVLFSAARSVLWLVRHRGQW